MLEPVLQAQVLHRKMAPVGRRKQEVSCLPAADRMPAVMLERRVQRRMPAARQRRYPRVLHRMLVAQLVLRGLLRMPEVLTVPLVQHQMLVARPVRREALQMMAVLPSNRRTNRLGQVVVRKVGAACFRMVPLRRLAVVSTSPGLEDPNGFRQRLELLPVLPVQLPELPIPVQLVPPVVPRLDPSFLSTSLESAHPNDFRRLLGLPLEQLVLRVLESECPSDLETFRWTFVRPARAASRPVRYRQRLPGRHCSCSRSPSPSVLLLWTSCRVV